MLQFPHVSVRFPELGDLKGSINPTALVESNCNGAPASFKAHFRQRGITSIENDWHGVNIVLGTYGGLLRTERLSIQMCLQRKSVKPSRPIYGDVRWLATAVKVPDASVNTLCVAQYTLCCFCRRRPG